MRQTSSVTDLEPLEPDEVYDGRAFWIGERIDVVADPTGRQPTVQIGRHPFTMPPEAARDVARAILAAVDYCEESR